MFIIFSNNVKGRVIQLTGLDRAKISKVVKGKYKGETETSFLIEEINLIDKKFDIVRLLLAYRQESILLVDDDLNAELHYSDGKIESIGKWTEVESIEGLENYSEIDGRFYTVV